MSAAAQDTVHVAQLASGGHVVVWNSAPQTANDPSVVYAQVFTANEEKVGMPVAVFGSTAFNSHGVVGLPDGSFLVSASRMAYNAASSTVQTRLYVQKVSSTGQLIATGGVGDPAVNAGLADQLLSDDQANTVNYWGGPFFVNADGSYVVAVRRDTHPVPAQFFYESLLNVDSTGHVIGTPVDVGDGSYLRPAISRLSGGNFLFASTPVVPGSGVFVNGPVTWKVVTNTGQVIAQQTLAAGTSDPQVTALADGTALLEWYDGSSGTWVAERIDANGSVLGSAAVPNQAGQVVGLAGGGYVATWVSGTQLLAQYFNTSGQPSGASFVVADNVASSSASASNLSSPWYWSGQTSDGFITAYEAATTVGQQIFEIRFAAPPLN